MMLVFVDVSSYRIWVAWGDYVRSKDIDISSNGHKIATEVDGFDAVAVGFLAMWKSDMYPKVKEWVARWDIQRETTAKKWRR